MESKRNFSDYHLTLEDLENLGLTLEDLGVFSAEPMKPASGICPQDESEKVYELFHRAEELGTKLRPMLQQFRYYESYVKGKPASISSQEASYMYALVSQDLHAEISRAKRFFEEVDCLFKRTEGDEEETIGEVICANEFYRQFSEEEKKAVSDLLCQAA